MNVYVIFKPCYPDDHEILGVFASKDDAVSYAKKWVARFAPEAKDIEQWVEFWPVSEDDILTLHSRDKKVYI